jgi:acetate kinase
MKNILIFNCGSSSQGFKVFRIGDENEPEVVISGKARNVATHTKAEPVLQWKYGGMQAEQKLCNLSSHRKAAEAILTLLKEKSIRVDAIGHRYVSGGKFFTQTARIDAETLAKLNKTLPLAPIHNPNSLSVIETCLETLPEIPEYVVFDTAFHAGMPAESYTYAIPATLAEEEGFRKYGFHGLSYQYVSRKTASMLGKPLQDLKLILCHLGTGGSSITAMKDGRSLDTSMGYSPLQGLVMSTRCGDIDAEVVLELVRMGKTADEIETILNNQSGLLGISGFSSNLEEVITEAERGNIQCELAFGVYAYRLQQYLGAFTWLLNGADAIVFTDDVGLHSWKLRERVCSNVEALGIVLDKAANKKAVDGKPAFIHASTSRTKLMVIPTDEERVILDEVLQKSPGMK